MSTSARAIPVLTDPEAVLQEISRMSRIYRKMRPSAQDGVIILHSEHRDRSTFSVSCGSVQLIYHDHTEHSIPPALSIISQSEGGVKGWVETLDGKFEFEEQSSSNGLGGPPCNDSRCCAGSASYGSDDEAAAQSQIYDRHLSDM